MYSSPELKRTFCMPYLSPSKHVEGPTVHQFQQEASSVFPGGSKQQKTFCFLFFFLDD